MSETLIDPALSEEGAITPVGEPEAPEAAEVEVESDSGEDTIPASRFNGLMSNYNKEQEARRQAELRISELETRLAAASTEPTLDSPTSTQEQTVSDTDQSNDELKAQVAQLTQLVGQLVEGSTEQRTENIRAKVLSDYPEVAEFADLIVADDEESFRSVAADIAARVNKIQGVAPAAAQEGETPPSAPVNPSIPQTAGAPPVAGNPTAEDGVKEALQKGDFAAWARARHGGADDQGLVLGNQ